MADQAFSETEALRAYCQRLTRLNRRLMALSTTVLLAFLVLVVAGCRDQVLRIFLLRGSFESSTIKAW